MAQILIGKKATVMKKGTNEGKKGYTYYFSKPFSAYDAENSECQGDCVSQEFSYTDFNIGIGEQCNPIYEKGFGDKAILVDLIPVKPTK